MRPTRTESPDNIRINNRQARNREIWASPEWKERKARFLAENPTCRYCGNRSSTPHHPDIEVYGKPEYLDLESTESVCTACHNGIRTGKYPCLKCGRIASKSEGEPCFQCLDKCDIERIKYQKEHRRRDRNRSDAAFRRKIRPRKVIDPKTGKWVIFNEP